MNTIFIKVSPEKILPTQTGRYHTNRGLVNYFHEELEYPPKGFEYKVDYWLKEIVLPTEEEIEYRINKNDFYFPNNQTPQWGARKMAKWFMDFILGVSTNEVKK